jgi:hypothetical protein
MPLLYYDEIHQNFHHFGAFNLCHRSELIYIIDELYEYVF